MMGLLFLVLVSAFLGWALRDAWQVIRQRREDCQWCDGTGDEGGQDARFVCEACDGTGLAENEREENDR